MSDTSHDRDIATALDAAGLRPSRIIPLKPRSTPTAARASYRVELISGTTVKVRRMETVEVACRQQELRALLPPAFTRVLARAGRCLIEEWIDGRPLTETHPAEPLIGEAARLMASLHRIPCPPAPTDRPAVEWAHATRERLAILRDAGVLDTTTFDALDGLVTATASGSERRSLIHNDLCGANMVVTRGGRLCVVDNEHMAIDAPGLDLARSWYRWGLRGRDWTRYCDAYREAGGSDAAFAHETFWRIAGTAISACIRLRGARSGLEAPLSCLRRLAQGQ